jgi:hypothetical protein
MRLSWLLLPIALLTGAAAAQTLDCPGAAALAGRCDVFHFHVSMYRLETKTFAEVWGINQFSSMAACERARDAAMKHNLMVVDYFKRVRNESQYEPDRFGSCHCDLSVDRASAKFLTDAQRASQLRLTEDIRQRIRERFMDQKILTDNELYRFTEAPSTSALAGAKIVPVPQGAPVAQAANVNDVRMTRSVDLSRPVVSAFDVSLVEVPLAGATPPPASTDGVVPPVVEPPVQPVSSAADAADSFITYETQRIQNVIRASASITDDAVKSKIYEACTERSQMLSNLRALIEGSGARSRLSDFARSSKSEDERLAFVAKLFGEDVRPHWAPGDAKDVVLDPRPDVDNDPERVLRDNTGRFNSQQHKRALYLVLARTQPTEQQQLWLTTVADGFLR